MLGDTGRKVIISGFYDYATYPMCDGSNLTSFQSPTNKLGIKEKLLQSCELNEVMNVKSSAQCLRQGKPIASSY